MPIPDLSSKRLIVVLGKGGVGRTTVAAALAVHLSTQGKRVLLYQANAQDKLSMLLGGRPVGEQIAKVRDNLWAVNPNPTSALHEYGLMVLKFETVYKMVFENRVSKALVRAIPGVDDYSILGKLWFHTTEQQNGQPRFDNIIFDAPATGHALSMLRIPHSILEAVPEGPLTRDAVKVRAMLEDPAVTAPLLVTLAEDMPTNETIELAARLAKEVGAHPVGIVVNQLFPDRFSHGAAAGRVLDSLLAAGGAANDATLGTVVQRSRLARARRDLNERYLQRLAEALPLPTAQLPIILASALGVREIEGLAVLLGRQTST